MRLVADENVDLDIVTGLRAAGHHVWYVAEEAAGIGDREVLERTVHHSALLVTADKDFGELVFRQEKVQAGVLLLRLAGLLAPDKARIVVRTLDRHGLELAGAFSVLTPRAVRIRRR